MWSIVHGFAHLMLGGEFAGLAKQLGGDEDAILNRFLPLTLKHLPVPSR